MVVRSHRENCGICHAITCEHTRAARFIMEAAERWNQKTEAPASEADAATVNHRHEVAALLAEIERLKAEVERLTGLLDDADQVTRDALGHARCAWEGDRRRLERALAAGPAALHYRSCDCCSIVEAAQAEAMKDGDVTDTIESLRAERDLLFDALNLHMRSTGITTEAMSRVEAFRAVVEASEPQVRGECGRLEKGWNGAADRAKRAEIERDAVIAACAELRAALVALESCVVWSDSTQSFGLYQRVKDVLGPARALLARTDLGRGKVLVEREVLERLREAAMGEIMISPKALADLDALLDGGKGSE